MKNKNPKNFNSTKNLSIGIAATLVQPQLLKNLVERLAEGRRDTGYSLEKTQAGWQSIETSSVEAYVCVDSDLSTNNSSITITSFTSFFFTCMKAKRQDYKLNWVNSLS